MERLKEVFRRVAARGCHHWTLPSPDFALSPSRRPLAAAQPRNPCGPVRVCFRVNSGRSCNARRAGSGKVPHASGPERARTPSPPLLGPRPLTRFRSKPRPAGGLRKALEERRLPERELWAGVWGLGDSVKVPNPTGSQGGSGAEY